MRGCKKSVTTRYVKRIPSGLVAAVAVATLFLCAPPHPANAAQVLCPAGLPGSLAFAGTSGLILCASGKPGVIVTARTDATAIKFSDNATRLQFHSGGALHMYDIAKRLDRTRADGWLLRAEESTLSSGLPGPTTLIARKGPLEVRVRASDSDDLDLAGIAPGGGTALFWVDPQHSASLMSDTVPLGMIALSAVRHTIAVQLPQTHPPIVAMFPINGYPLRDWISFAPDGSAFVAIAGGIRDIFHFEHLARCTVRNATCEQWNHRTGFVELDPAWSPAAEYVAFVRAVELHASPGTPAAWRDWNDTRQLVLAATDTKKPTVTVNEAGHDVSWPTWIASNQLLFISHDRLREYNLKTRETRVLANLAGRGIGYYGYVARSDRFAWAPLSH